jgi:hypothetical protein
VRNSGFGRLLEIFAHFFLDKGRLNIRVNECNGDVTTVGFQADPVLNCQAFPVHAGPAKCRIEGCNKIILVMIAVAGGLWAYLHLLAFLKERGYAPVTMTSARSLRRWKFKPSFNWCVFRYP